MAKLRVAQSGCGYWGPDLLRNLAAHPSVELVGVVESDPHREVLFTDAEILDANLRPRGYRLWQ